MLGRVYQERASWLDGAVVWSRPAAEPCRVLPDGCIDLIWSGGTLTTAGPDTRSHLAASAPGTVTGVRFAPGTGPAVLGVPAHELRDLRVPLDAVWSGAAVRRLVDQAGMAGDPGPVLEAAAAARLRDADPPSPELAAIVRALRAGRSVAAVACAMGLSERHLHRRCLTAFGYGPKMLARVLRMNSALELARARVPYIEVAVRCGYADQAHMAREVKLLAGVPLGDLTS